MHSIVAIVACVIQLLHMNHHYSLLLATIIRYDSCCCHAFASHITISSLGFPTQMIASICAHCVSPHPPYCQLRSTFRPTIRKPSNYALTYRVDDVLPLSFPRIPFLTMFILWGGFMYSIIFVGFVLLLWFVVNRLASLAPLARLASMASLPINPCFSVAASLCMTAQYCSNGNIQMPAETQGCVMLPCAGIDMCFRFKFL